MADLHENEDWVMKDPAHIGTMEYPELTQLLEQGTQELPSTHIELGNAVWTCLDCGAQFNPKLVVHECQKRQDIPVKSLTLEDLKDNIVPVSFDEGRKDDSEKLRYDLIPPEFLEATADILTFGAMKYGERNWEKGMKWGRPFAALMRHMWAWWRGEKGDKETGKSHLWHAACCIAFLITFEQRQIGMDNRSIK